MSTEQERRLLTTDEAARYCASAASTFEKMRVFGGGPMFVKLGRRVAYRVEDLDAWIDANRRRSTSHTSTAVA
jgi:predicted DNA-binding transcriptional regulator AlpA